MNNRKLRKYLAYGISLMPGSGLRRTLYGLVLGYGFGKNVKIGHGVVISVDQFKAGDNVIIGRGTTFIGPISVNIDDRATIGKYNKIECGDTVAEERFKSMNYARSFEVGVDSLINESHLFDVLGRIKIGRGSWIAGFGSQFLTHGASAMNRDISIGEGCFLGSAVRFAPGSAVADRVIVAMGAIVTKAIPDCNAVIGGVPARVLKQRTENDGYKFEKSWL